MKRHRVGRSGRRLTESAELRAQAAERAALIHALGWKPEKSPTTMPTFGYADRYAATSGELRMWARQAGKVVPEWQELLTPEEREEYTTSWLPRGSRPTGRGGRTR